MTRLIKPILILLVIPNLFSACTHSKTRTSRALIEIPHSETEISAKDLAKIPQGNSYYYYVLAKLSAYQSQLPSSLVYMDAAVQENSSSSFLQQEKAEHQLESSQLNEALESLKKSIEINPNSSSAHYLLGKIYSAQRQSQLARREFKDAIRLNPKNEEAYGALAKEYLATQETDKALALIQQLQAQMPQSIFAYYYLGNIYMSFTKERDKAIRAFQQILQEDPDEERALQALGQLYLEDKKLNEAMQVYLTLQQLEPNDLNIQLRLGLIQYELKQIPQAVHTFETLISRHPRADRGRYYLGSIYQTQGRIPEALAIFEQIPPDSSFYKESVIRSVVVLRQSNKLSEAIRSIEQAIEKKKDIVDFYDLAANLYFSVGDYGRAIEVLKKGILIFPQSDTLYFSLGMAYGKKGDPLRSIESMKKSLEINPNQVLALNYIAYSYADRNIRLDEAQSLILRAVALKPKDGHILDSLGWIYFKRGDLKNALLTLKKADEYTPNEPVILEHLGDVYLELSDLARAVENYERALKIIQGRLLEEKEDPKSIIRLNSKVSALKRRSTEGADLNGVGVGS